MKTKIRAILIISAILLGLVGLAFVFGCEDEAEARDKGWKVTEDGGIEIYKDGVQLTGSMFSEPDNPILYIGHDTIRLQPGSSIKYIEIGDPNVIVTYFEPNKPTDLCIKFGLGAPDEFIIKDCDFDMTLEPEPNEPY